jgi:formate dehydrogenase maturation protein FdhE
MSRQYLRITCTNCGVTSKVPFWGKQMSRTHFIKKCYHCDPNYIIKKKDKNNDVNTQRKTI